MNSRISSSLGQNPADIYPALRILSQRFVRQIDIDPPGQRKGDNQRRAHQEIRFDRLMNSRLEISVAAQDTGKHQIVFRNKIFDGRIQRARISDAGHAAISHDVETDFIQVLLKARLLEIFADDAGTGRQRSFHISRRSNSLFHRFFRHQSGGNHDVRIGGIGAGSDRGNYDGTVAQACRTGLQDKTAPRPPHRVRAGC